MQYCDREALDSQERRDLLYLIRHVDRAYLEHCKAESEKKSPPSTKGGKIGGRK